MKFTRISKIQYPSGSLKELATMKSAMPHARGGQLKLHVQDRVGKCSIVKIYGLDESGNKVEI